MKDVVTPNIWIPNPTCVATDVAAVSVSLISPRYFIANYDQME